MPISIVVPQLGESVAEGTVAKWLKAEGERVRKEEPLVEIQTDKINVEIPSPAEGTLVKIMVPEGTTVLVGTEIAQLSGNGEPAAGPAPARTGAGAAPAPAQPGRAAEAPAAPRGQAPRTAEAPAGARPQPPAAPPLPQGDGGGERNLSPVVRKMMREENVSPEEVGAIRGSGVGGRVTRDDLIEYLRRRAGQPAAAHAPTAAGAAAAFAPGAAHAPAAPAAPAAAAPPPPLPRFMTAAVAPPAGGAREEVVPFNKVRKLIAEHMLRSKHNAAHTHCFDEADMGAVAALRKEWGPRLEARGVRLTYMPFFIKASVLALKEFPWVNAEVRDESLVVKRYYNIGIAVGRDEKGLIVPNIKDCDRKNLVQIAAEVNDLAARARADRLKPDEIQGGTFSITNAGVYGAVNSSPVINYPEVAILGVHKVQERAVIRDGQIVARPMMNASIGFDHRVVDGELAVKFLRRVCELLERPELLWFHT